MERYRGSIFTITVYNHKHTEVFKSEMNAEKTVNDKKVKKHKHEYVTKCKQRGDNTYWMQPEDVSSDLFKHADKFDWTHGIANLWIDGERVTRDNYRTLVEVVDEEPVYTYADYNLMTNIEPPMSQEI